MRLNLPTNGYLVLGLLSFGKELSGYEIRKEAENLQYFYWRPAQSQIYRELRRLESLELATSRHVQQEGKSDKQLFRITQRGMDAFKHWMMHEQLSPTVIKHPVLLKIYFMHVVEPAVIVRALQEYIESVNESLGQLAIVSEFVADDEAREQTAMIVAWNTHYFEAELTMAKKLLARFTDRVDV